ncbi:MAG: dihydrolipoyl dehydrogenase [Candidatus Aminicenantes bacterium]|nr:dihydrolipoyl dehydrogenase [Candidatus Aminicenantes bacterium]
MVDIAFLGGGPAGYEGAITAARQGLKALVVEKHKLGGTCLQWGCIPTKTLIHAARMVQSAAGGRRYGLQGGEGVSLDPEALGKQKDRVVSKLTRGIEFLLKETGVEWINNSGTVVAGDTIRLQDGREIKARHIVIATGSRMADLPHIKIDAQRVIGSRQALDVFPVPRRLLVIGAGAIGMENAFIYRWLGSEVTVVELMEQVVPGSDVEAAALLTAEMKKQKIRIHTSTRTGPVHVENDMVKAEFTSEDKQWEGDFDKVLLAVGRRPVTEDVFDHALPIQLDQQGFIQVDENLKTGLEGVYACGDVIGQPLLAHKASHQAMAIVNHILHGRPVHHHAVPAAVFTNPEMASVGMTEIRARERYGDRLKVGRFPYAAGSRANAVDEKAGLVKVLAAPDNTVLGGHIVGAEAAELILPLTLAVEKRMKADDLLDLTFVHPTLGENVWEALAAICGRAVHI